MNSITEETFSTKVKSTNNATYLANRRKIINGRMMSRQFDFIRHMANEGFNVDEIQKVFVRIPKVQIQKIINS